MRATVVLPVPGLPGKSYDTHANCWSVPPRRDIPKFASRAYISKIVSFTFSIPTISSSSCAISANGSGAPASSDQRFPGAALSYGLRLRLTTQDDVDLPGRLRWFSYRCHHLIAHERTTFVSIHVSYYTRAHEKSDKNSHLFTCCPFRQQKPLDFL